MRPIVTPAEMREIDRISPIAEAELIERAGAAVARSAIRMLGGRYGRRVVMIAGPGNNGADGRAAARHLRAQGVAVTIIDAGAGPPDALLVQDLMAHAELVIDAAFGTGLRSDYLAPDPVDVPVLAVDIVSGLDGSTGVRQGRPMRATCTVTFAAAKPGHFLCDGAGWSGDLEVVDIGLDVSGASIFLMTDDDVVAQWPRRRGDAHKWNAAVWVIAGSPEMTGAPTLASSAALRSGSGYVRLSVPADDEATLRAIGPLEVVRSPLPASGWASQLNDLDRVAAMVVGPGLGRRPSLLDDLGELLIQSGPPLVIDGDGLWALAELLASADAGMYRSALAARSVVLTPHDGEFERLAGHRPRVDRLGDVRELAMKLGATVLLKGGPTIIGGVDGFVRVVTSGDSRLATAGTGDVLSGMVAALLAHGLSAIDAAAIAAHVHGRCGSTGKTLGLIAGDLIDLIGPTLESIMSGERSARTLR